MTYWLACAVQGVDGPEAAHASNRGSDSTRLPDSSSASPTPPVLTTEGSLTLEAARYRAVGQLRSRFEELAVRPGFLSERRWAQHFEQWLWSRRLAKDSKHVGDQSMEEGDLLVPSGPSVCEDAELARKLAANGASVQQARDACRKLGASSCSLAAQLRQLHDTLRLRGTHDSTYRKGRKRTLVVAEEFRPSERSGKKMRLSLGGKKPQLEITLEHLRRLQRLYMYRAANPSGPAAVVEGLLSDEQPVDASHEALVEIFRVLCRYSSAQGGHYRAGAMQAAVPPSVLRILSKRMGVSMECYASPFNCFWSAFGSAFPDTDGAFGSVGRFEDMKLIRGSYEINPPFEEAAMLSMAKQCLEYVAASEKAREALSFAIIIPKQEASAGWQILRQSPYLKAHWVAGKHMHGYIEGNQHMRGRSFKVASFETSILVVQTSKATAKWPPTSQLKEEVLAAFAQRKWNALTNSRDSWMDPPTAVSNSPSGSLERVAGSALTGGTDSDMARSDRRRGSHPENIAQLTHEQSHKPRTKKRRRRK